MITRSSLVAIYSLASLPLVGCSSFDISRDAGDGKTEAEVGGVPFYLKKAAVQQATVYERTWMNAIITYTPYDADGKPIKHGIRKHIIKLAGNTFDRGHLINSASQVVCAADDQAFVKDVVQLEDALVAGCSAARPINCAFKNGDLERESSSDFPGDGQSLTFLTQSRVSSKTDRVEIVDYNQMYYFNSTIPPFGTTTAHIELNSDGTLTKADSTVDTTKLAEVLPVKDLLLDRLGLVPPPAAVPDDAEAADLDELRDSCGLTDDERQKRGVDVSVELDGYSYTLTKMHPDLTVEGLNRMPLLFKDPKASIERTRFGKKSTKPEASNNAIKFSGAVELPKTEAGAK